MNEADAATLKAKFNITRPFLLYTGGADERKNLPRLIQAYARLEPTLRETHQLVLAGKISEGDIDRLRQAVKQVGLTNEEVCFTGYVTDDELVALYNLCTVFVFPSWHEGFGLPALEAMACGAAVIGANCSSLPEVIGQEDALFDALDVDSIAAKIARVLQDDNFKQDLCAHGLVQAKLFSWDETARRAIAAFESISKPRDKSCGESEPMLGRLVKAISESIVPAIPDSELRAVAYAIDQSVPENVPRQLFVDISELVQRDAATGVQRVTRSILHQLLLNPPAGYVTEPVYATIDQPGFRYARKFMQALGAEMACPDDEAISARPGDVFLGLDLQHHTARAQAKFLLEARQNGVSVYFVVYDLLPIQFPGYWPPGMSTLHHDWLYEICKFDGVVCISRAVADELTAWLKEFGPPRLRPLAVKWFHLGADIDNSASSKALPDNANDVLHALESRPTFLSVGTIEPRKGQMQTLAAFELLWLAGQDINLVLVGKQGWMVEALVEKIRKHAELGKRLFWLDGVSDEYLEKIYVASTCLIAASEGEGFGLPLIEAAQHKLSIIARDIPVFREVAGAHAYYFEAKSADALSRAITAWLALYDSGQHPKSNEMPWLTWRESAKRLGEKILSK